MASSSEPGTVATSCGGGMPKVLGGGPSGMRGPARDRQLPRELLAPGNQIPARRGRGAAHADLCRTAMATQSRVRLVRNLHRSLPSTSLRYGGSPSRPLREAGSASRICPERVSLAHPETSARATRIRWATTSESLRPIEKECPLERRLVGPPVVVLRSAWRRGGIGWPRLERTVRRFLVERCLVFSDIGAHGRQYRAEAVSQLRLERPVVR